MRWIASLDEVRGADACAWTVRLDDEAAERAAAAALAADLAHAAQARAADGGAARLWRRRLLRALSARWLDVHPAAIEFASGQPRPARLLAPAPLFVSAASRGPWTVAAIGPRPLGVDVELAGAEIAALGASQGASPTGALRRWTAAEAYAKATGCSLDLALVAAGLAAPSTASRSPSPWGGGESKLQPRSPPPLGAGDPEGVEGASLQAPGYLACTITHRHIGDTALVAAAEA